MTGQASKNGLIGYEFEVETEERYLVTPGNPESFDWVNHVIDTYDRSGRARIRIKNGEPRLSLKVPLFSKDTDTAKTCLRLEFKPTSQEQKADLMRVRELLLAEPGTQVVEKWGAPLTLKNGQKSWINRDSHGAWWVEVDEGTEFIPPDTMEVLGNKKSSITTT